jgi:hypothetical protein
MAPTGPGHSRNGLRTLNEGEQVRKATIDTIKQWGSAGEIARKTIGRSALIIAAFVGTAILVVAVRAYTNGRANDVSVPASSRTTLVQGTQQQRTGAQVRLSLQPEADKFRRRLGKRFTDPGRERATGEGTLRVGAVQYQVVITRTQNDDGEHVEISLSGGGGSLTWNGTDGAKSAGRDASVLERSLTERLALDSPDQFVLAQLRGASYFTIARMAAPKDADENYSGPFWNLVRIVEPQRGSWNKPQNEWRIYYINNATGLIDKITYQDQGQNITVDLSGWTNRQGELDPSLIRWTREGKIEMELSLNNAGHVSR